MILYFPLNRIIILMAAVLLDLVFGDPQSRFHPIVAAGRLICFLERKLLKEEGSRKRAKGFILVAAVCLAAGIISYGIVYFSFSLNILMGNAVSAILLYFLLCSKSLYKHGIRVYRQLEGEDIGKSRIALQRMVSRRTEKLGREDIIRGAVESISENTSDGITAPLFYYLIGGIPLAAVYKAVNTLDSMVGYRTEKYRDFGYFSARFDDILNYVPARITALISSLLSFTVGGSFKASLDAVKKYASRHKSPNSGYPEAAFAGALGVRLGGAGYYFNQMVFLPYIGKKSRDFEAADIKKALKLSIANMASFMFIIIAVYTGIYFLFY
ncbi:MAG: adenosylcobinamide-phosphate synthase CbiB [Actinomycetota bacterium]